MREEAHAIPPNHARNRKGMMNTSNGAKSWSRTNKKCVVLMDEQQGD
jgi:hypothetical protein